MVAEANKEFVIKLEEGVVKLGKGVADVLSKSRWWEGTGVDRGIVLAVALVVDNEKLICPAEVYQSALVERLTLEGDVSLEAISTRAGRATIRQQCLERIEPATRQELLRSATTYIEQVFNNITTVLSNLTPPDGGIQRRKINHAEARRILTSRWWTTASPLKIVAEQLLCDKRICPVRSFEEALKELSARLGIQPLDTNRYDLTSFEGRERLATNFFAAARPETLRELKTLFPMPSITQEPAKQMPLRKRLEVRSEPGSIIRFTDHDFCRSEAAALAQREYGLRRPVYELKPQVLAEINTRSSLRIDLTQLPDDWFTFWPALEYQEMKTLGGLFVTQSSRFHTVRAGTVVGGVFVVHDCTANAIDCVAVTSRPVALVDGTDPGFEIMVQARTSAGVTVSLEHLLPFCQNPDVLRNLIQRVNQGERMATVRFESGLRAIYEPVPETGSTVTIDGFMSATLMAVEKKVGPGFASMGTLVGVASLDGSENQVVESFDSKLQPRQPIGQSAKISWEAFNAESRDLRRRITSQEPRSQRRGHRVGGH